MKWHFVEMHCHTQHSDGSFSPEALAQAARDEMLDGIALTDHNAMSGHKALRATGLPFIPGIEWTTFYGHMLVLGAKKYVDWRDATPDNIDEKMQAVHAAGGLVGVAHPFDLGSPMCTGCYWDFRVKDWNNVDYIEVWHGEFPPVQWKARRAMKMWTDALDSGCRIAPMYGRDWHGEEFAAQPFAATMLGTQSDEFIDAGGYDAVKNGRVILALGPAVYWQMSDSQNTYEMGDTVRPGKYIARVQVDYEARRRIWQRFDVRCEEVVFFGRFGKEIARTPVVNGVAECEIDADEAFVRMEVHGSAMGKPCAVAISAPVYIEA